MTCWYVHSAGNAQCDFLLGFERLEGAYTVNETKHFRKSRRENDRVTAGWFKV